MRGCFLKRAWDFEDAEVSMVSCFFFPFPVSPVKQVQGQVEATSQMAGVNNRAEDDWMESNE